MRWDPQEKGVGEGSRDEGEGEGCEDGGNMGSLGRKQHPVYGPLYGQGERVTRRQDCRQRQGPPPSQNRGTSTLYSILQPNYSPLTQPACNEHIYQPSWTLENTKRGKMQHGSMGSHSKAHPPSSPEGRHRHPHLPQVQIEVQRDSVTGQRSHSQKVAVLMSVQGLLTPNPTLDNQAQSQPGGLQAWPLCSPQQGQYKLKARRCSLFRVPSMCPVRSWA